MRCGQSVRVIKRRDEIWGLRTFRVTVLSILSIIFPYMILYIPYGTQLIILIKTTKNIYFYYFFAFACLSIYCIIYIII